MMGTLILTRAVGESIIITVNDITIKVSVYGVKGNQVRLGTHAPENVSINREEIYDRIKQGKNHETNT